MKQTQQEYLVIDKMPDTLIDVKDFEKRRLSLGKMLKDKYPDAYGKYPDGFLTGKLADKYPEAYGKYADAEFGTITRPSKTVEAYSKARDNLLSVLTPEEKSLYKGEDPQLIANAVGRWASRQLDRPIAAIQSICAGQHPIKGFVNPEQAPSFGTSAVKAWKITDPIQAKWVAGLTDVAAGLGAFQLTFNTAPQALFEAYKGAEGIYTGMQGKALGNLRVALTSELGQAGIPEATAEQIAKTTIAKHWATNTMWQKTPAAINETTRMLKENEGKLSSLIRMVSTKVKEEAAAKGYADEWFEKAMGGAPRLEAPAPISSTVEVTKAPVTPADKLRALMQAKQAAAKPPALPPSQPAGLPYKPPTVAEAPAKPLSPTKAKPPKQTVTAMSRLLQVYNNKSTDELYSIVESFGDIENLKPEEQVKFEAINRILNEREQKIPSDLSDEEIDKLVAGEVGDESKIKPIDELYKEAKVTAVKEQAKPLDNTPIPEEDVKVDPVAPIGVEKTDVPFQPEIRPIPKQIYGVTLNTIKGPTITYMGEEELAALKKALAETQDITKPVMYNRIPVTKVVDEFKVNMSKLDERGSVAIPFADDIQKMYDHLDAIADPVRAAPPEVARNILQRDIDLNVHVFNVAQVAKALKQLVPDVKQQEIISQFIEPAGEELVGHEMTPQMRIAAQIIINGQKRVGKLAKKYGVIKNVLDNYIHHMVQDPDLTAEEVDSKIRWAISTNKISKWVASKFPRVKTETGEILFPTVDSLEKAGYKVTTKNAIDLYEYIMRSEGIATINAELADRLQRVPYVNPLHPEEKLFQVMRFDPNARPPKGYRLMRRGPFTMAWASPEAYGAISNIAEPPLGGTALRKAVSGTKFVKFALSPMFHGWNFDRNATMARGIIAGQKLFFDGAKLLEKPENVSAILKTGSNLFRINQLSGGFTDEFGDQNWKILKPFRKVNDALFCGMGDSLTAGLVDLLQKQLAGVAMSETEKNEVIADIANNLSGNLSPSTMGRGVRDYGRIFTLARNWTISNIRTGLRALGKVPKYWSNEQKEWATKWYQAAMVRGFAHLYAAADIINYASTQGAYGKGRHLWQNPGITGKMFPVLWVDKKTGVEISLSNWYGSLEDIVYWISNPRANWMPGFSTLQYAQAKLSIPIQEVMQQMSNTDFFTRTAIRRDSDSFMDAMKHSIVHAVDTGMIASVDIREHKTPVPVAARVARLLGFAVSSQSPNQDEMKKIFNFREKKKYKVQGVEEKVFGKMAVGDYMGAVNQAQGLSEAQVSNLLIKSQNSLFYYFNTMSARDKIEFLRTMQPKERAVFIRKLLTPKQVIR